MMALILEAEQKLERAGLIAFFEETKDDWCKMAARAHAHLKEQYPENAPIRPDDVAKILSPVLGVDESLTEYLSAEQLRQRYWYTHFTDLIIDRCWTEFA